MREFQHEFNENKKEKNKNTTKIKSLENASELVRSFNAKIFHFIFVSFANKRVLDELEICGETKCLKRKEKQKSAIHEF